jgi:Bacterial regulatory protein, Fis family
MPSSRGDQNAEAFLTLSASHVECVGHLVGYRLAAIERELVLQTLGCVEGNRTYAATVLGISIRALRNKIRAYRNQGERVPEPGSCDRARTPMARIRATLTAGQWAASNAGLSSGKPAGDPDRYPQA